MAARNRYGKPVSTLDRDTLVAYLQCRYEVHARRPFVLRVGERSRALAALYARCGSACAAYLSACNPRGELVGAERNARATRRLQRTIERRGYAWIEGFGRDPGADWPGEASVLVPAMGLAEATELAGRFAQNALLWAAADARPQLILLR